MPTSRRWPVPHGLAVACGVVLFGAFFVLCGGISMGKLAVIGLGIGLIAVGAGLAILAVRSRRSSSVVMGVGHVLDRTDPPVNVEFGRCKLHLAIATRDLPSTSIKVREPRVPIAKWPDQYADLPVLVSTAKPLRVRVLWDRVPTHLQTAAGRRRKDSSPPTDGYAAANLADLGFRGAPDDNGERERSHRGVPADQPVPSAAMRVIYLDVSQVRWSDAPTPEPVSQTESPPDAEVAPTRPPGTRPSPRPRPTDTPEPSPDVPPAHIPRHRPASSDDALGNGAPPDTGDAHNGDS